MGRWTRRTSTLSASALPRFRLCDLPLDRWPQSERGLWVVTRSRLVLPAPLALDLVLRLRLGRGLPLHVARRVRPSARERHFVIDDVPGPAVGVAGLTHEILFQLLAALDPTATDARSGRRGSRVAHRRGTWRRGVRCRNARAAGRRRGARGTGFAPPLTGCVPRVRLDGLPGARGVPAHVHATGVRAWGGGRAPAAVAALRRRGDGQREADEECGEGRDSHVAALTRCRRSRVVGYTCPSSRCRRCRTPSRSCTPHNMMTTAPSSC